MVGKGKRPAGPLLFLVRAGRDSVRGVWEWRTKDHDGQNGLSVRPCAMMRWPAFRKVVPFCRCLSPGVRVGRPDAHGVLVSVPYGLAVIAPEEM